MRILQLANINALISKYMFYRGSPVIGGRRCPAVPPTSWNLLGRPEAQYLIPPTLTSFAFYLLLRALDERNPRIS